MNLGKIKKLIICSGMVMLTGCQKLASQQSFYENREIEVQIENGNTCFSYTTYLNVNQESNQEFTRWIEQQEIEKELPFLYYGKEFKNYFVKYNEHIHLYIYLNSIPQGVIPKERHDTYADAENLFYQIRIESVDGEPLEKSEIQEIGNTITNSLSEYQFFDSEEEFYNFQNGKVAVHFEEHQKVLERM